MKRTYSIFEYTWNLKHRDDTVYYDVIDDDKGMVEFTSDRLEDAIKYVKDRGGEYYLG